MSSLARRWTVVLRNSKHPPSLLPLTSPTTSYSTDAAEESSSIADQVDNKPQERVFFKNQPEIDGFKVFDPYMNKKKQGYAFSSRSRAAYTPKKYDEMARYHGMPVDQEWNNVWPTASMFKQNAVPFAVRQGYVKNAFENDGLPPEKYGNTELMKIPNFLHLTPPQIKKHCEAIKKFCTEFPKELKSSSEHPNKTADELCRMHFPVEITESAYIYDGPSIRDDRARKVTLKINLDDLNLSERARFKFKDLVGERYDRETNEVTIESERCPYRHQNKDYVYYLLTTLYFESQKIESWEEDVTPQYAWDKTESKKNVVEIVRALEKTASAAAAADEEAIAERDEVKSYRKTVSDLFDHGASAANLEAYKKSVLDLLKISAARQ